MHKGDGCDVGPYSGVSQAMRMKCGGESSYMLGGERGRRGVPVLTQEQNGSIPFPPILQSRQGRESRGR